MNSPGSTDNWALVASKDQGKGIHQMKGIRSQVRERQKSLHRCYTCWPETGNGKIRVFLTKYGLRMHLIKVHGLKG